MSELIPDTNQNLGTSLWNPHVADDVNPPSDRALQRVVETSNALEETNSADEPVPNIECVVSISADEVAQSHVSTCLPTIVSIFQRFATPTCSSTRVHSESQSPPKYRSPLAYYLQTMYYFGMSPFKPGVGEFKAAHKCQRVNYIYLFF